MKFFAPLLLVLSLYAGSTLAAYQLIWADEFNGKGILNESNWEYDTGCSGWGNNELECYTGEDVKNARQEDGHLVIDVQIHESDPTGKLQGHHFSSARVKSIQAWSRGKFEIRARAPAGKHLWPAIWMFPKYEHYGMWAASGEIDIMEMKGDDPKTVEGTMHFGGSWPNMEHSGSGPKQFGGVDFSKDFHTFTLEWDEKEFRWFVDNNQYHKENLDRELWSGRGPNPYTAKGQPFDQKFFFIFNIAVGGQFFGGGPYVTPIEARSWPKHTMEIDYVRVYENK